MSRPAFNRADTLLGVCQALGDDLGFNPLWLRVAFALGLFWSPTVMLLAYALLGVAVYAARWLTPDAKPVTTAAPVAPPAGVNDDETVELRQAA